MNTQSITTLLKSIPEIELKDAHSYYDSATPGLSLLILETRLFKAVISIQGAQLLEFIPTGKSPLLWLSPNATFKKDNAIRGGIPICLPWFGVNPQAPEKPKHGFVRSQDWTLISASCDSKGCCRLKLTIASTKDTVKLYPYKFSAELNLTLSETANIGLTVYNQDTKTIPVSWAFHSYHPVDLLEKTQVYGLENSEYLDNTDHLKLKSQTSPITFENEVDRVYERITRQQTIENSPRIAISGKNCPTAIVWNPGAENAEKMPDIGKGNHTSFVCVERGAAFADSWNIPAGDQRSSELNISHINNE